MPANFTIRAAKGSQPCVTIINTALIRILAKCEKARVLLSGSEEKLEAQQ